MTHDNETMTDPKDRTSHPLTKQLDISCPRFLKIYLMISLKKRKHILFKVMLPNARYTFLNDYTFECIDPNCSPCNDEDTDTWTFPLLVF